MSVGGYLVDRKGIVQWPRGSKTIVYLTLGISYDHFKFSEIRKKAYFWQKKIILEPFEVSTDVRNHFFRIPRIFLRRFWLFWNSWFVEIDAENIFFAIFFLQQQPTWTSPLLKSLVVSKFSRALTTTTNIHSSYILGHSTLLRNVIKLLEKNCMVYILSFFFSMWPFALLSAIPAAFCFSAASPLPARCFCFSLRAERGLVTP